MASKRARSKNRTKGLVSRAAQKPVTRSGAKNARAGATRAEVDAMRAELARMVERLGVGWRSLSKIDRNRRLKMPRGGAKVAAAVTSAARRHGIAVGTVDLDRVDALLAASRQMRDLTLEIEVLSLRAGDIIMQADSEVWRATTLLYSLMARIGRSSGAVNASLGIARAFFKKQRRGNRGNGRRRTAGSSSASGPSVATDASDGSRGRGAGK